MPDIDAFQSCETLSRGLSAGAISSVELVEMYLGRIAALDGKLHAFVEPFEKEARLAAEAADKQRRAGRVAGPLHGIPLAIKDLYDYAGHPTNAGSRALKAPPAAATAAVVRRLEAAGMIVLGKTHTVEFAYGGWGTNPVLGTPWNPWDLQVHRAPGGSSSGSAIAVAAGLAPVALGSDTGGSLRTPACFCGVVGMKTSRGLIGRGGVFPLSPSLDVAGPLARSVADAALLIDAMEGFDPLDETTAKGRPLNAYAGLDRGMKGFRIGRLAEEELTELQPGVRKLLGETIATLKELGAAIVEVKLPRRVGDYLRDAGDIMSAESYANLAAQVDAEESPVAQAIRERIGRGRDISAAAYIRLIDGRRRDQGELAAALEGIDAVVAPICQAPAPVVAEIDEAAPPTLYGRFVNYLDLASLAVPVGSVGKNLPMGMQIIVRRFDDALALRIGHAFEQARGGLVQRPAGL